MEPTGKGTFVNLWERGTESTTVRQTLALARDLILTAPWLSALAAMLLLTAGITEAFGLLMMIPLLQVAGLGDTNGENQPVVQLATRFAESLNIPLDLSGVLVVFLILAAVRSAAAWGRTVLTTRLRLEFADRLRGELYAAVAGAAWHRFLGRRRSDIQYMLTDNVVRVGSAALQLLQLTVGITLASIQFAIALAVSPTVTTAAAVLGLVLAVAGRPLVRRSHKLGGQLMGRGRILRGYTTDFLDGLKPAKMQNAEAAHVERFQRQAAEVRGRQVAFATLSAGTRSGLQFAASAALAGLVWYALASSGLTLPELALLALAFARATPTLLNLLQWTQSFANTLPAYAVVTAMRNELRAAAEISNTDKIVPPPAREIEVRNISFLYPGSSTPALSAVSCRIPANGIFAITGPSGSGKTTLADLLLGLLEPTSGSILVDGVPLAGSCLRHWRSLTACVAQDPFLLNESVRSNLIWARRDASEAEMGEALRLAAADFVDSLEQGLDTVVGDRGSRLSGGERQRVALAAALLRKPALLVLDEPTGQLDTDNEERVAETLCRLQGRATVVVVTHSESLLGKADRVLMLNTQGTQNDA